MEIQLIFTIRTVPSENSASSVCAVKSCVMIFTMPLCVSNFMRKFSNSVIFTLFFPPEIHYNLGIA